MLCGCALWLMWSARALLVPIPPLYIELTTSIADAPPTKKSRSHNASSWPNPGAISFGRVRLSGHSFSKYSAILGFFRGRSAGCGGGREKQAAYRGVCDSPQQIQRDALFSTLRVPVRIHIHYTPSQLYGSKMRKYFVNPTPRAFRKQSCSGETLREEIESQRVVHTRPNDHT